MSFILDTSGIPRIDSYAKALTKWESTKPFETPNCYDTEARPLDVSRRKRHVTIRKLADGSLACKLHHTDVVVWHPDNSFTLTAYRSMSTDAFASTLTPQNIYPRFNSDPYHLVQLGGWNDGVLIELVEPTRFVCEVNTWGVTIATPAPDAKLGKFTNYTVDRKAANAALKKHKFHDFVAWAEACHAFRQTFVRDWGPYSPTPLITMLDAGPESWPLLLARIGPHISAVREAVYKTEHVIASEQLTYLPVKMLQQVRRSQRWRY